MNKRNFILAKDEKSESLRDELMKKNDVKSIRMQKLFQLPDLSRKENSPIKFIVDKVLEIPLFKDFDIIECPEIVTVRDNFDLLNAPADHPSRKETDTYYVDKDHILRTQTTVMWPFYLQKPEVKKELEEVGEIGLLSFGKVYRKDEIDRNHFPVFHQIDGLYICKKDKKVIGLEDLQNILVDITKNVFGETVEYQILDDSFPFTNPSTQIEIKVGSNIKQVAGESESLPNLRESVSDPSKFASSEERWLEIVGAGIVHTQVLKNLNLDPEVYNGWAFGFGLERLAMIKNNIPDIRVFWSNDPRITSQFKDINSQYSEVSKYPMTYRDISFVIKKDVSLNNYYEIVRDFAEDLIEEVKLADQYENVEKFGEGNISYTFRITYRSPERTLTNEEVNKIQEKIIEKTKEELGATIR